MPPFRRFALLTLASALAFFLAFRASWPALSATGRVAGGAPHAVTIPWMFGDRGDHEVDVVLHASWLTPSVWRIVADDELRSLTINGAAVPLDGVPKQALYDYSNGFELDLQGHLTRGRNELVFQFSNGGGDALLDLQPQRGALRWSLLGASFVPFLVGLSGLFRLRRAQMLAVVASLVPLVCYWAKTPWNIRGHDVAQIDGHLSYVLYVADHASLPDPASGWTYYHPPLYYVLGAVLVRVTRLLSLPAAESLQALAIALWLVFVVASAGALRLSLAGRRSAVVVASLAVAFWPSGILAAVRLGNDPPFYAIAALATWFLVRFWRGGRTRDLALVSVCVGLALLCKANATVLCALAIALVGLRVVVRRRVMPGAWKRGARDLALFAIGPVVAVLAGAMARAVRTSRSAGITWFVGNAGTLNPRLRVPSGVKQLLSLDIVAFVREPWLSPWRDETGRAHFWNYLLRSALSGEFWFGDGLQRSIALTWGPLFLAALVIAAAVHLARLRSPNARAAMVRQAPWVLSFAAWLAAIWVLRVQVPYCCSNDFRYVLPMIVPTALFVATAGALGRALLAAIAILTTVFFVTL